MMAVIFAYFFFQLITALFAQRHTDKSWTPQNITYLVNIVGMLITVGGVIFLGAARFEGGASGFGLAIKKPAGLFTRTLAYSVVIFGLVFMVLMVTLAVCKLFGYGVVQKHGILEMLAKNPPKSTIAILVVLTVVVAPLVEELIFRGLLQSYFIGLFARLFPEKDLSDLTQADIHAQLSYAARWLGIAVASAFFALVHADWQHMPALFVLGVALGYVREKHGSLVIPIAIHSLFNLLPMTLTIINYVK